jgi:hypothetical protein
MHSPVQVESAMLLRAEKVLFRKSTGELADLLAQGFTNGLEQVEEAP